MFQSTANLKQSLYGRQSISNMRASYFPSEPFKQVYQDDKVNDDQIHEQGDTKQDQSIQRVNDQNQVARGEGGGMLGGIMHAANYFLGSGDRPDEVTGDVILLGQS